eukprot:TRINITY_DN4083_c5_g1_i1.p1 TRINITY_DN4083_c5_g1~~TRINITY_DN4083_c5_g1_i1.p1  ORF type:complete len:351 (+),score=56.91 TRINITY_DN4083_c5_g1_i1:153-1055(+)
MPKRIGKYELGAVLGEGNFSKVREGVDVESKKQYAIKIVDKGLLEKGQMEQQLKREIAIMKLLDHENVLSMRDVLQTSKNIYLILDLLTGDLFYKLNEAKWFDEKTALYYFHQLIAGLNYLHGQGIAHRDLKPENLLLTDDGQLKIADFGFSRLLHNKQLLLTVCGTPNYMAPEVLKERGYDGKIADIWSCGVILYAMLAGYLPFDDEKISNLCKSISLGAYRISRKFSPNAISLLKGTLTVNPADRITIPDIIKHPFFRPGCDDEKFAKKRQVQPTEIQVNSAFTNAHLVNCPPPVTCA